MFVPGGFVIESYFDSNLNLLQGTDPELAARLVKGRSTQGRCSTLKARNGMPSLRAIAEDGRELPIHSEYDPAREAVQFVGKRTWTASGAYLLRGLGLGYSALQALPQVHQESWVGLVEGREDVFLAAMDQMDLSPLLERGRIRFFVGNDIIAFQGWITRFIRDSGTLSLHVVDLPSALSLCPAVYAEMDREMEVAFNRETGVLDTSRTRGKDAERNAMRNLEVMPRACGMEVLKGAFSGIPAIIIGAGPSLTPAIPHLAEVRDRVLLFASDAAYKPLMASGVTPHALVSTDPTERIMRCLEDVSPAPGIALLFGPDNYFEVPGSFAGPLVTYENGTAFSRWSREFTGNRGVIAKGSNVAHTAFAFGRELGCNPLVLVGVDLGFPSGTTHAEGVPVASSLRDDDPNIIRIPGVRGELIRSTRGFQVFVSDFEEAIAEASEKVYQTSEFGALIRGAENVSLGALKDRLKAGKPVEESAIVSRLGECLPFDKGLFDSESRGAMEDLNKISSLSEEALKLVRQAKQLDPANKMDLEGIRKKLARCKRLEEEALRCAGAVQLLERLHSPAARKISNLAAESKGLDPSGPKAAKYAMEQYQLQFSSFREHSEFFASELEAVRGKILGKN